MTQHGTSMQAQDGLGPKVRKQHVVRHRRERSVTLGPCMQVQFEDCLRFQLPQTRCAALLAGATATLGRAHDRYAFRRVLPRCWLNICAGISCCRQQAATADPA